MRRSPLRIRRLAKWTSLALCILFLWTLSGIGNVYAFIYRGKLFEMRCLYGAVDFQVGGSGGEGWTVEDHLSSRYNGLEYWNFRRLPRGIRIPLVVPLVVMVPIAAVLWWLDRNRVRPGHCLACGYNQTGNASGVCPECGSKAEVPKPVSRGRT